eukprot:749889-Hanusia_phi.AAC.2
MILPLLHETWQVPLLMRKRRSDTSPQVMILSPSLCRSAWRWRATCGGQTDEEARGEEGRGGVRGEMKQRSEGREGQSRRDRIDQEEDREKGVSFVPVR